MHEFPDEVSIRRAIRQNAQTAPAVDEARWEDVGESLDVLMGEWTQAGGQRFHAYRVFSDCDTKILAALLTLAVERLVTRNA